MENSCFPLFIFKKSGSTPITPSCSIQYVHMSVSWILPSLSFMCAVFGSSNIFQKSLTQGPAPTTTCSHSIVPLSVSTPVTAVTGVETDKGTIECEQVVVGAGPWVRDFWNMLELPKTAHIKDKDGKIHETDMWTYWMLQEGVIGVDPDFLKMNNGKQLFSIIHF